MMCPDCGICHVDDGSTNAEVTRLRAEVERLTKECAKRDSGWTAASERAEASESRATEAEYQSRQHQIGEAAERARAEEVEDEVTRLRAEVKRLTQEVDDRILHATRLFTRAAEAEAALAALAGKLREVDDG